MILKIKNLDIKGVKLFKINNHVDNRGTFKEVFLSNLDYNELNLNYVQENESISNLNVFRGMHFQKGNFSQSKLLRVVNGSIFDVLYDLRKKSKSFGKLLYIKLSVNQILFIPKGVAHGFLSLENNTIVNYKCDVYYSHHNQSGFNPFKSKLNIDWPINPKKIILSEKDKTLPSLNKVYKFE